jgi:hypothetical protein
MVPLGEGTYIKNKKVLCYKTGGLYSDSLGARQSGVQNPAEEKFSESIQTVPRST